MLRYHKVKAGRRGGGHKAGAGGPSVARLSVHLQLFLSVRVFVRPGRREGEASARSGGGGRTETTRGGRGRQTAEGGRTDTYLGQMVPSCDSDSHRIEMSDDCDPSSARRHYEGKFIIMRHIITAHEV